MDTVGPTITPKLVLVTGANGYIASSLTKSLLEKGYRVRGTVHDVSDESKTAALKDMPNASTNLELVPLELEGPQDAFDEAVHGVEWVFHTASPVPLYVPKDEQTVIGPAVKGTLDMLRAASKTATVSKFILTSSCAAIEGGHEDKKSFTEEDWTNVNAPHVSAYEKSKTLSEKAAWKFMEDNSPSFTLTVINPVDVVGPIPSAQIKSSSEILARILRAQDPGTFNMFCPLVDIRDVVKAHIHAAAIPEAAGKRFILCQSDGGEIFMPQISEVLKREFGPMGYTIRTIVLPKWFAWLLSWVDGEVAFVYATIDNKMHYDNTRSCEVLRINYIPTEQTIIDGGHSLIEHGVIPKKAGYKGRSSQSD
jgi:nucleoside-diphosphate-sugar epimerase